MKFRSLSALATAAVATCMAGALSPPALATTSADSIAASDAESFAGAPDLWFVQFKSTPAANGSNRSTIAAEQKAFRDAAAQAGVKYTERMAFSSLWNGVSVVAGKSEIGKIRQIPGVTAVWPVALIEAPPKGSTASPELFTAITMTGADIAQSELGYTGKGVKVAVMDTGIDVDHVAFGGDGVARQDSPLFPSQRVAYGYDFVGNAFNADPASPTYNPVPVPDANPDDCGGHGSHVAGIVGANDPSGLKGVAPDVTFGAYRVFGCDGSTTADIMIAAMERALRDGMDVLNMSIGSAYQWPQYPTAVAASRLVDRGMVVVASIGNSGANGLYSAGAPGLGENVIGTASFDNVAVAQAAFSISPDNKKIGYNPASGSPPPPPSGAFPMARTGTQTTTNDACAALPQGSLAGKVALVRRGTCSFYIKASNAQAAGAIAVVLYNNQAGQLNATVAGTPAITVPVVGITQADGNLIDTRLASGPVTLTWGVGTISSANPNGNLISSFSSYGLSPDLALKPDIGAPGGSIWSTYPIEKGAYLSNSGTSMASPHVAGAVALLLQAKPKTKASDVRAILQNSADPKLWWGNPGLGYLDNVHRQGAGMVDVDDSILATTLVTPSKISVGEGEAGPRTFTLRVTNGGGSPVTYDLTSVNALSTGGVIAPSFTTSDAKVTFGGNTVTAPPGGSATFTATITPATAPVYGQYGGYIVLTPQGGGQTYRVPFAGFVGDYQGIVTMLPTASGFPWLARLNGANYTKVNGPQDWTFTLENGDVPYFLVHFEHQVQQMEAVIKNAATGAPVHPVFNKGIDEEYLPRNSTSSTFFAFSWDGTRIHSNGYNGNGYTKDLTKPVADGQYIVELRALKAGGTASNPAHWETWTSPVIAIDRP